MASHEAIGAEYPSGFTITAHRCPKEVRVKTHGTIKQGSRSPPPKLRCPSGLPRDLEPPAPKIHLDKLGGCSLRTSSVPSELVGSVPIFCVAPIAYSFLMYL